MPSSSPRCAQFPRAQDKVHFYIKLKELRDQIKGSVPSLDVLETEYSFDLQLAKGTIFYYPLSCACVVCVAEFANGTIRPLVSPNVTSFFVPI